VGALARLVEHSLVEVREDGGETRYRLLETVRQFGAALLADTPDERATRVRHARWIARVAASAEPHLFSPARGRTVRRLQRDVDDIRAALAWTTRRVDGRPVGEPMTAVRIAGALGWFWFSGVPWEEARTLLAATLAAADAEGIADADRPLADRVALGTFFYPYVGQHYFASDTAGILALVPRELAVWDAVDAAGAADPAALSPAERLAAARGRALAYQLQALALAMHGDAGRAHSAMARSLATAEAAGDAWLVAVLTMRRALVHLVLGDPAAAAASYGAAIPLLHALGERWFLSLTYEGMAAGALLTGDLAAGVRDGRRSVQVLRAERDEWFASRSLDTLAALLAAADARRDDALALTAVRLLGAAEALRRRCGALPFGPDRERQARVVAALRARLDPDAYAAAHAAGASMTLDDVFAFVDDDAPFTAATVAGAADASHHASRREATRGDATGHAMRDGDTREVTRAATRPRMLRLDAFGPFALVTDGVSWPAEALPLGKTRELLLWLLLHERGTKEEIAMDLWPDASSAQVRSSFHVTLHHLRRQLGDPAWIAHDRGGYRLARRPDPALILDADVDAVLDAAARLRASGRAPDGAGDADARDTALAMARGALERRRGVLAEGMTAAWLAAHRARVQGAWADAMEALAARLAAAGRADEAHDVCERLVACEPLRESAHRQLMAALAARGETARALAHYRQVERLLDGALGARPSRETQRLAAQLAE
jgi:DNA-binding SARP family transcriptional activator